MSKALTIRSAPLPATYEEAREALAKCERADECQAWADKAAALASYAKQAKDETLIDRARRIQLRAVTQGGKLLEALEKDKGGRPSKTGATDDSSLTPRQAAVKDSGLSDRQAITMIRAARVPDDIRESLIEGDKPPTVKEFAKHGKRPAPQKSKPPKYRNEWVDWTSSVSHLTAIPECGLAVLLGVLPATNASLLREAEEASVNLNAWLSELRKENSDAA